MSPNWSKIHRPVEQNQFQTSYCICRKVLELSNLTRQADVRLINSSYITFSVVLFILYRALFVLTAYIITWKGQGICSHQTRGNRG